MHKNYTFIVNLIGNKIINNMLKIIPTKKNTNNFNIQNLDLNICLT